jgi:hypothetical protein
MKVLLPSLLALAAMSGIASATVVNIDFGTTGGFTGLAGAPDPAGSGAVWNTLTTVAGSGVATSAFLNDSTGGSTSVGFQVSATSLANENQSGGNGELSGTNLALMRDYLRISSGSGTTVVQATGKFTGLVVGSSYELYFYGQGQFMEPTTGTNRGQNSLFTVGGISKQTGWDGTIGGDGFFTESVSNSQQGEFVKFSAVADINGEISFLWANVVSTGSSPNVSQDYAPSSSVAVGSQFAALNGVQLIVVPEPSTFLLSAVGVFGLLFRRRR